MRKAIGIVSISLNQGKFLAEAINSVLAGGASSLDYVVVDPGSADESREIIGSYGPRIRSLLEPDAGPADGLNRGFELCDAEIYGFLNADDRYVPGALAFVESFFSENPSVDVLTGTLQVINSEGRAKFRKRAPSRFTAERYVSRATMVLQQSTFFRRRAWLRSPRFNPDNRTCWDAELFVAMALQGLVFSTSYSVLAEFRQHDDTISRRTHSPGTAEHARFLEDDRRIYEMVWAKLGPPRLPRLRRLAWRTNVWRRVMEVCATPPKQINSACLAKRTTAAASLEHPTLHDERLIPTGLK